MTVQPPPEDALALFRLGPIEARVEAEAVRRYREATSFDEAGDDVVPATFPAIWLWHPAAQSALEDMAGLTHGIPVLIAQRFSYRRSLTIDETIRFYITRRIDPAQPGDVQIEAHVEDLDGRMIADFTATYRLFEPEAAL
jgi:hypothetical protein